MNKTHKIINEAELNIIAHGLKKLLSGYGPLSENGAFNDLNDYELIGEEFQVGSGDFFDKIVELSRMNNNNEFFIVRYSASDMSPDFILKEGYAINYEIDYEDFFRLGIENSYIINGSNFCYVDQTFNWCVLTFVDVQLLFANCESMKFYFKTADEKMKAVHKFNEFLKYPHRKKSFKGLSRFIKYKINDNWFLNQQIF